MKILKDPKGLKMKPCLNCRALEYICPCPNHTGEIHREIEQGEVRITEFICENRKWKRDISEATKMRLRKMGNAQKGKKRPEKTRRKISEALKGIRRSQKTKRKISETMVGRLRAKSNSWKGGKTKHSEGYILTHSPTHPCADHNGYVTEHRLIMEKHLGGVLLCTQIVHHINGIRGDNRIENLRLFNTMGEHTSFHNKNRKIHQAPSEMAVKCLETHSKL